MGIIRRTVVTASCAGLGLLVMATPALAVERFASSAGINTGTCVNDVPANAPCSLFRAVTMAAAGDVVTVLPDGAYTQGAQIDAAADIVIRGAPGQANPQITFSSSQGLGLGDTGSEVRELTIVNTNTTGTALSGANGSLIERVNVRGSGFAACSVRDTATIRDSVCWNTSPNAGNQGVTASSPTTPGPASVVTIRNVTAIATGTGSEGIDIVSFAGEDVSVDGRNVIAAGTSDDVRAIGSAGGGIATGVFGSSNYDDATATPNGGTATLTQEGSATIQGSAPIFQNAPAGDFHQATGSPTIDAGTSAVGGLGSLDLDREPRLQGPQVDIGADELVPPSPGGAGGEVDTRAPFTLISGQPKKKTRKRKASFTFGSDEPESTFECSLDDGPFEFCVSPIKYRRLEGGKHVFAVRATDPAGNLGAAVEAKWKIRPRHR